MKALDSLERYPQYYTRRQEQILLASGNTIAAWTYMLPKWRKELIISDHMESYSSKGPHGREYILREFRPKNDGYDSIADVRGDEL
jgi:hypothetical protein